jgi:phage-related protein
MRVAQPTHRRKPRAHHRNRISRVLFTVTKGQMVLLHGFIKKTEKTEDRELDLAMKRKKEL